MAISFNIKESMYKGCGRSVAFFEGAEIILLKREGDLPDDMSEAQIEAQIQLWVNEGGIEGMCSGGRFVTP